MEEYASVIGAAALFEVVYKGMKVQQRTTQVLVSDKIAIPHESNCKCALKAADNFKL